VTEERSLIHCRLTCSKLTAESALELLIFSWTDAVTWLDKSQTTLLYHWNYLKRCFWVMFMDCVCVFRHSRELLSESDDWLRGFCGFPNTLLTNSELLPYNWLRPLPPLVLSFLILGYITSASSTASTNYD
jgi:hypothetical protein